MKDYIELTKPRITWLILMSTGIGYYFGLPKAGGWWAFVSAIPWWGLLHTILGTGLIASGTAALNQWYERDADCREHQHAAGKRRGAEKLAEDERCKQGRNNWFRERRKRDYARPEIA